MRPQLMSVMCRRPSMPPRSTNAPNSAMFLTIPSAALANLKLGKQLGLLFGPLGPRSTHGGSQRCCGELRRFSSTRHWIVLPMKSPMSAGRRTSTWLAGKKTFTPDPCQPKGRP